jgi:hypothetical protein
MTPPGVHRQWRWYHVRGSGRLVAKEEFGDLPIHGQAALWDVMRRWARGDTLRDEVKSLGDDLLELRVNVGNDHFRLVFFRDSPVHDIVVLAVYKNQRRLPATDLKKAKDRMAAWRDRGRT